MDFKIKNREARREVFLEHKHAKNAARREARQKRKREEEENPDEAPPRKIPKTQESTREVDETIVMEDDEEVKEDEQLDKFASYFRDGVTPKILVTTSEHPSKHIYKPLKDILKVFPNSFYYKRGTYTLKQIIQYSSNRGFTDVLVVAEHAKEPSALYIVHLPDGPTAYFKLTNFIESKRIPNHAAMTAHEPELVVTNFNSRLGHSVGRMFAALFPHRPNFQGRRVITFHNQRDFIFFRQHRYIFENKKQVRMQEMGPRFTLKLQYLQHGAMDTVHGEYEWIHKVEMDTSRRRFFL